MVFYPIWDTIIGILQSKTKNIYLNLRVCVCVSVCVCACLLDVCDWENGCTALQNVRSTSSVQSQIKCLGAEDPRSFVSPMATKERKKKTSSSEARQFTLFLSVQCRCTSLSLANQWNPRGLIRHRGMSAKSLWSADLHPLCFGNNAEEWSMFACF